MKTDVLKIRSLNLNVFILSCIWIFFNSCGGRDNFRNNDSAKSHLTVAEYDTVQDLSNNIMRIYQDKKGNIWFCSWQDGLYKYDGKTILHFTTKSGLAHNRVEEIQEDEHGTMYFNTSEGLCKFDGHRFERLEPKQSTNWDFQPGDLWFKGPTYDGKVYRYDGRDLYLLPIPETKLGQDWVSKYPNGPSPYGVYTIYKDIRGDVWFGTAALGALRFNGRSFDWISEVDVNELHDGPSNGVRSIIEDSEGYLWFNSAYRYYVQDSVNLQREKFYTREKSIGNLDGRPDSDFSEYMSIARDNNDDLWIATYNNGVWRYDGTNVIHYPVKSDGKDITLFYIYKDNDGILWLGTHENGVYQFNGTSFKRFRL